MERLGVIEWLDERLHDPRNPDLITYPLTTLLRSHLASQPTLSRLVAALLAGNRPDQGAFGRGACDGALS